MARNPAQGGGPDAANSPNELPQHPLVDRLKPDPTQDARKVVTLVGLPGKSDRPGYQRLYLTTKLDYYAEFQISDMVHSQSVPADQSPIDGQEATSVTVARDATIHYIWATSAQPMDEFDLDVRLGTPGAAMASVGIATRVATCFPDNSICRTCDGTCDTCLHQATCHTCPTQCNQATCQTCQTQCNQPTCPATCQTCHTGCDQQTCHTCQTLCNQLTCNTCRTQCNQPTCVDTCHTACGTCGATCTCHPNQCQ